MEDDVRSHYDFDYSSAKQNRFVDELTDDTVIVILDSDVALAFSTSESVNEALRLVIKLSTIPAPKT